MDTSADWAALVTAARSFSLPRSRDSEISSSTRRAFGRLARCSMAAFTASSMTACLCSPALSRKSARWIESLLLVQSCNQATFSEKESTPAQPRSPVTSGWIMTPIFLTFSSTGVEIPADCTAMTSAMGATPVAIVSTVIFRSHRLSRSRKSAASSPSTERPLLSDIVTGTSTRRERTLKRESWAASGSTKARMTAHLIIVNKSIRVAIQRETGDRQDCQRISGKGRRKSMAVLSVPGGHTACSLAPQGNDRIHRGGPARGDVARQERNSPQEQRDRRERQRIGGADAVQQACHKAGEREGRDQPRGHSDGGQFHPLVQDEADNLAARSSQGGANSEFVGPPGHRIGHDAVDADGGQQQGGGGEDDEQ